MRPDFTGDETERRIRGVATNPMDYVRGNVCPRLAFEEMVGPAGLEPATTPL